MSTGRARLGSGSDLTSGSMAAGVFMGQKMDLPSTPVFGAGGRTAFGVRRTAGSVAPGGASLARRVALAVVVGPLARGRGPPVHLGRAIGGGPEEAQHVAEGVRHVGAPRHG